LIKAQPAWVAHGYDPAASIDALFSANGWGRSWRDSIYDFLHYRSQIHEVMPQQGGMSASRAKRPFLVV
jgi:uncharacterized protein YjlB